MKNHWFRVYFHHSQLKRDRAEVIAPSVADAIILAKAERINDGKYAKVAKVEWEAEEGKGYKPISFPKELTV